MTSGVSSLLGKSSVLRYGLVGLANTAIGLSLIYAFKYFAGFGDALANFLGYAIAVVFSYVANSRWTFQYKGPDSSGAAKFLITLAAAYLCNLLTVLTAIHVFGIDGYWAQPLGIAPYAVVGYLGNRYFAFRPSDRPDA